MSNQEMTVQEILGYKASTLSILSKQIEILQKAEQRILPKKADLDDAKAKDSVLTVEKSGELQEILCNEISKLEQFDVVLAVVGTMKAGKSTTINAIVGREILPNRNRPMTALPTLICHNPAKQIPSISIDPTVLNQFLSQLQAKLHLVPKSDKMHQDMHNLIDFIADGGQFNHYYEGEENIFEFLYQLNDLVRLSKDVSNAQAEQGEKEILHFPFDEYKNFNNLPMIEVAFKLESDFETQGRFMLLDTAGPNEAGQDELKEALTEQLARSSAVMIVLDYTQLNSDAEKDVKDQIDKIPTVQKSRLFALVNKFDQKNANSDEADATRKHIFNNLLKDKIELDNIYAISAQDAYLAKRLLTHIEQHNDKPMYQADNWVADFAQKMYGRRPEQTYNQSEIADLQQDIQDLLEDSRMAQPMENVIVNMQRNAPFIAIQSALAGAGDVFNRLHNVLNIKGVFAEKEHLTQQEIVELKQKIEELKADTSSLEERKNQLKQKIEQSQREIYQRIKLQEKLDDIRYHTQDSISKIFSDESTKVQQQLNEMEAEKSSFLNILKLKTEREIAEEKAKLDEMRARAKSDGDTLVFSNEDDLKKFKLRAIKMVNGFVDSYVIVAFDELLQQSLENIRGITSEINQESEQLSELLKTKFQQDGFDLRIEFDADMNLDKNIARIKSIQLNTITQNHSTIKNEDGFFGGAKRFFGGLFGTDWGTYQVDYTTHTIYKRETIQELMNSVQKGVIAPLQRQVDDKVQELLNQSMDYIDSFAHKVDEITYELQQSLEHQQMTVHQSKEEKEDEKQFISSLRQAHDDLDVDWQKLKEKFKVEDIKS